MIKKINYIFFIIFIVFSFIASFFSISSYQFCPKNPQMGFICYCAYYSKSPGSSTLSYSTRAEKQINLEKFIELPFYIDDLPVVEKQSDLEIAFVYKEVFYKSVPIEMFEQPPRYTHKLI